MANISKYVAGTAFTSLISSTELNSLANGSGCLLGVVVSNGTNLDLYGDISFSLATGSNTTAGNAFDFYLMPLNQDATNYGDGTTSTGATAPNGTYYIGSVKVTATTAPKGTLRFVNLPPTDFKIWIHNNSGQALSASPGNIKYKTYNIQNNA